VDFCTATCIILNLVRRGFLYCDVRHFLLQEAWIFVLRRETFSTSRGVDLSTYPRLDYLLEGPASPSRPVTVNL
jgi:hypothetical protein